jgi:hypothetical protein
VSRCCRVIAIISCDSLFRDPSELAARAATLDQKDMKISPYKRIVKGGKSDKSAAGLIACLSAE